MGTGWQMFPEWIVSKINQRFRAKMLRERPRHVFGGNVCEKSGRAICGEHFL
jgi:hypothetical protein